MSKNFLKIVFLSALILNLSFYGIAFGFLDQWLEKFGLQEKEKTFESQRVINPYITSGFGSIEINGEEGFVSVLKKVDPEKPFKLSGSLRRIGAVPIERMSFLSGLDECYGLTGWQFEENPVQYYNLANEPILGGERFLRNTHDSWGNVETAWIEMEYGGLTSRCPSLAEECGPKGPDGYNDVGWIEMDSDYVLGRAYYFYDRERKQWEIDIILNSEFNWSTDGTGIADVETVLLHENGHLLGLYHPPFKEECNHNVMWENLEEGEIKRELQDGDIAGLSFIYGETKEVPTNLEDCLIPCGSPIERRDWSYDKSTETAEITGNENGCVSATANGEIASIYFSDQTKSWRVEIRHTIDEDERDFYFSVYEGIQETHNIETGDKINKGDAIGIIKGDTLLYRVYRDGIKNPAPYLDYKYEDHHYIEEQEDIEAMYLCRHQAKQNCKDLEKKCIGLSVDEEVHERVSVKLKDLEAMLRDPEKRNLAEVSRGLSEVDLMIKQLTKGTQVDFQEEKPKENEVDIIAYELDRIAAILQQGPKSQDLPSVSSSIQDLYDRIHTLL